MKLTEKQLIQQEERKLWCDMVVAYTSASNSMDREIGVEWADYAVENFKERFKQ